MIPYQSTFDEDGSRKLRDKFDAAVSPIVAEKDTDIRFSIKFNGYFHYPVGNTSKYEREMSNFFLSFSKSQKKM